MKHKVLMSTVCVNRRHALEVKFKDFDRNSDGYVDLGELTAKLTAEGWKENQVKDAMKKYDKDADGKLNFEEFATFCNLPFM